jgi:hypothetical protein
VLLEKQRFSEFNSSELKGLMLKRESTGNNPARHIE